MNRNLLHPAEASRVQLGSEIRRLQDEQNRRHDRVWLALSSLAFVAVMLWIASTRR